MEEIPNRARDGDRRGSQYLLVSNYADVRRNTDTFEDSLRLYNLRRRPFTEFHFNAAVIRELADGDGSRGRQMLLASL
ncbi:MAG TPA: hypothetical protein VFI65_31640 [Streptosporangiaceae bacterium]|nr:hypothetical protein [Streptosporangiaceae bacterium]